MNLLFVLSLGFDRPGPSIHLLTALMDALAQRGHTLTVVQQNTGGPGPDLPEELAAGGRIAARTLFMPAPRKQSFAARYLNRRSYARAAARQMAGAYDLVYIHSCQNLNDFVRAARRRCPGAKIVLNVQDIFPQNAAAIRLMGTGSPLYRLLYDAQARAYQGADAIITLSPDMEDTLIRSGADKDKVCVIPPWTYSDHIAPVPTPSNAFLEKYPEARGFFRVVYAGNVGQMQNVEIVLEAARLLADEPGVLFMVVGGGARADSLKERARGLANLRFYPMQPPQMAPQVYAMADINLITLAPGVTATAFPSKTAICCAVGRPILAAVDRDSHYFRMIDGLDGCRCVPAGDAGALAQAVRECYLAGSDTSQGALALYRGPLSRQSGIEAHIRLFEQLSGEGGTGQ